MRAASLCDAALISHSLGPGPSALCPVPYIA